MVAIIVRILTDILSNYVDYFPPNFTKGFLAGRQSTFPGWYEVAFFTHITSSPICLIFALFLVNRPIRNTWPGFHRELGKLFLLLVIFCVAPSGLLMAIHSMGGWKAGLAFVCLALATFASAVLGFHFARKKQFNIHEKWMWRCFILLCSAPMLRFLAWITRDWGWESERAYQINAWLSWVFPWIILEMVFFVKSKAQIETARPKIPFGKKWS